MTVITSITSLSVSPTSSTLNIGETVQLTGTVNPSTTTESTLWTSSNTNVATVNGTGLVTAKAAGTVTITFKNSSGTKSATCKIIITTPSGIVIVDVLEHMTVYNNDGNIRWAKTFTSTNDYQYVVASKDGSIIRVETPLLSTKEKNKLILQKYNNNGNKLWEKSIDFPTTGGKVCDIDVGSDNSIVVGITNYGFLKFDQNGNLKLSIKANNGVFDPGWWVVHGFTVECLAVGNDGTIYIGGTCDSGAWIRGFITAFDSNGNFKWEQSEPSSSSNFDYIYEIIVSSKNDIYVRGNKGWYEKFNSSGKSQWTSQAWNSSSWVDGEAEINSLTETFDNCIILGLNNGRIRKVDSNKQQKWEKQINSKLSIKANNFVTSTIIPPISAVTLLSDGNIVIGSIPTSTDDYNYFGKYDINGNQIWKKKVSHSITNITGIR